MQSFQKVDRLFSSTDRPAENRHHDSKAMKISAVTDDKTKEQTALNSSYLTSQFCASQNLSKIDLPQRQPSSKAPLAVRDENRPSQRKTKFDLNRLAASNSFKQSIFSETPRSSYVESEELLKSSTMKSRIIKNVSRNAFNFKKNLHKDEVESVIFDSKAVRMDGFGSKTVEAMMRILSGTSERQLKIFESKMAGVNDKIDTGMGNISKMIRQVRVLTLEKKIQAKENKCKMKIQQNLNESKLQEAAVPLNKEEQRQQQQGEQADALQLSPSASKIQLAGHFHSEEAALSQEYTIFINRLSHQIQLDMQFTQLASDLSRTNSLPSVKALIISRLGNQRSNINQSFFDIDPAEVDPLQKKSSSIVQISEAECKAMANKLYSKYQEIEGHFKAKLQHTFTPSIISLLFEELSSKGSEKAKEVSVGELLSYLNMRTSSSFRNRFLVKVMKRLGLKSNGCLTPTALQIFTTNPTKA